jgi:SAM-dependent methyltransferase
VTAVLRWVLRRAERRPDLRLEAFHRELLDGVSGVVVEVGCGRGRLFDRYPQGPHRVVAVEPDPHSRAAAERAASRVGVPVEVVDGDAERLPLPDGAADAVVLAEVLCSVVDPVATLAEARRVLRPGGELRVYEHILAPWPAWRLVQRLVDLAGWPRVFAGCRTTRDSGAVIASAGFGWVRQRRVWQSSMLLTSPSAPHLLGVARLPAD